MLWVRLLCVCSLLRLPCAASGSHAGESEEEGACSADRGDAWFAEPAVNRRGHSKKESDRPGSLASQREDDAPFANRSKTVLQQEVEELRGLSDLYRQRITLLEKLKVALSAAGEAGVALDSMSMSHLRMLQEAVPPLSTVVSNEETSPVGSVRDFLVSKAVIPQEEEVSFLRFLPMRNPRTSSPAPTGQATLPSTLLIASNADGLMRLFTPSGELACTFSAGHDLPLVHVAVSPLHDEYLIATCDTGGIIRVHKVSVRQRRFSKEDRQARRASSTDKVSQHLGSQVNATVQFNRRFRVPNNTEGVPLSVMSLALASQQGTKYFVVGHLDGKISVFTRNGTLHGRLETGLAAAVESFNVHLGTVIFVAGGRWGIVDLEKMEARPMTCNRLSVTVSSALVDAHHQSRVLVIDTDGYVWVLGVQNKRQCKVEHRFPQGSTSPASELGSVRGFALALERGTDSSRLSVLTALNMSHAGKTRDDPARTTSPVVWRRYGAPVRDWSVHRRYQQGDLIAMLSQDGLEIEVFEMLMQVYIQPQADNFANLKLPVFAVAIVLVLGYQYVKGKGAFDPSITEGM